MPESGLGLPADASGKAMRTNTVTTAFTTGQGGVVHQQVVTVGDGNNGNIATVGPEGGLWVVPRGGVRTNITFSTTAVATSTTESLIAMNRSTNLAAVASASAYTVTSGKTFRIQGITITGVVTGTTVTSSRLTLRAVASGSTLAANSPAQASFRIGNASVGTQAANYGLMPVIVDFGDGMEFTSGQSFGITAVATTNTMHALDVNMFGYEY